MQNDTHTNCVYVLSIPICLKKSTYSNLVLYIIPLCIFCPVFAL